MAGIPTGPIRTPNPWNGGGFGTDWGQVTRWEGDAAAASVEAAPVVPVDRALSHLAIESQGIPGAFQDNEANGDSYGLMQVVPKFWRTLVQQLSGVTYASDEACGQAMISDPVLAIRAGVAVLRTYFDPDDGEDAWDKASSRYFVGNSRWEGGDYVNHTTAERYRDALRGLMSEIAAARGVIVTDPLVSIVGGSLPPIDYGWCAIASPRLHFYRYFDGPHGNPYGNVDYIHPGIDIGLPLDHPLFSPGPGVVTCAGTGVGPGSWGSSCAAYEDTLAGGTGRVEILLDNGVSVIFGHTHSAGVKVGQRVARGQYVASVGGMNGAAHVHLETRVWHDAAHCPSSPDYCIVDPRPALAVFGGTDRPAPSGPGTAMRAWAVAGSTRPLSLPSDVDFVQKLAPVGQVDQRPGTPLVMNSVTAHDTGNEGWGMDALAHADWLLGGARDGNGDSQEIGAHFFVDDERIVQCAPINELVWHAGDGATGPGNTTSLAVILCVNADRDPVWAERNFAALCAALLALRGKPADALVAHRTWVVDRPGGQTTCPASLLGKWDAVKAGVAAGTTPAPTGPTGPSGPSGVSGPTGPSGASGPSGPTGIGPGWNLPAAILQTIFPQIGFDALFTAFWKQRYADRGRYPATRIVTDASTPYMIAGDDVWVKANGVVKRAGA